MTRLTPDAARRLITLTLWGACWVSAGFWLQAGVRAWRSPAAVPVAGPAERPVAVVSVPDLARVLGASAQALGDSATGLTQRFRLAGVIATASGQGAALLSIDGQPARPFSVGAEIAPGFWLQSVGPQEALLAGSLSGPVLATLQVPEPVPVPVPEPVPEPTAANLPEAAVRSLRAAPN